MSSKTPTTPIFPGVEVLQQMLSHATDSSLIDQRVKELKLIRFWLEQNISVIDSTIASMDLQARSIDLMKDNPFMKMMNPAEFMLNPIKMWADSVARMTDKITEATTQK